MFRQVYGFCNCNFVLVATTACVRVSEFYKHVGIQGEEQKKLDVLSNEVFVKALISSGRTVSSLILPCLVFTLADACSHVNLITALIVVQSILVSEEDEEAHFVEPPKRGKYVHYAV